MTGTRIRKRVPVWFLLLVLLAAGYRYVQVSAPVTADPSAPARPASDSRPSAMPSANAFGLEAFSARCVGVSDGDTLVVLTEQPAQIRIRLIGVDAPEKKQAFGEQAKQFVADTVLGNTLRIHPYNRDRYGRLLVDAYLEDGTRLNERLVREGLAWWYRTYAPQDTVLKALEEQARTEKKGLWRDPNPVPPWEFRRRKLSGKRSTAADHTDRSGFPDPLPPPDSPENSG